MGEIFRREAAPRPEPFTGERLTTAVGGQVQIEHYHRYLFARSLVSGLDVLDVASGEGYGSALLAQVARLVIGVEYSGPTAVAAASNFLRPNLRFLQGDARALPLADRCLDAVVSFETIEHFDRQNDFLREIRRVLRPGGMFIVSTPDRDVYSPLGSVVNPFHVHELSRDEFIRLLSGTFQHVRLVMQRPLIGSALLADTGSSAPPLVFDRRGETHFEACVGLPRAAYVIAVASDREPPPLPPSLYIDRSDLDTDKQQVMTVTAQLTEQQSELTSLQQQLARAHTEVAQANARATNAEKRVEQEAARGDADRAAAAQQVLALRRERDQVLQQYHHLQGSLRSFMRGYLPRLRRHLLGQRP
jgi:SAM-dependent methyltransferase